MMFAILERPVAECSARFARLLARRPLVFIVLPILLTAFLSLGIIFKLRIVRGVHWLYSPLDSEWKIEEEVFRQNWASNDQHFFPGKDVLLRKGLYLIVSARDGSNVLTPTFCNQLIHLLDTISNSSFVSNDGKMVKFGDICLRFQNQCFANSHVRMLAQVFAQNQTTQLDLHYPLFSSKFLTEPIDVSSIIGGVELDHSKHSILSAKVWMLIYQLRQQTSELDRISSEFQYKLPEMVGQMELPNLKVDHFHSEAFDDELVKNTREMAPRFAITFCILISFTVLCAFTTIKFNNQISIDWVVSKPLIGVAGVISTLMAIVSATGLLLLLDVAFVDICTTMPFLALSIGVDDSMLLLSAWRETSPKETVEKRIELTLRHSGVAILITSIADSLAFLVGSISTMPSVRYFSLYSSLAICFIYFYTMTIFAAIMVLQGHWEQKCYNSVLGCRTESAYEQKNATSTSILFNLGNRPNVVKKRHAFWYQRFFAETFSNFISHPLVQLLALLSYLLYLFGAINGLLQLRVGFDLMSIVRSGSPTEHFIEMRSKYFADDVSQLDVAVLQPPNMGNRTQRSDFLEVLEQFETTNCSTGRQQTKFWFFGYQSYLNELGFGEFDQTLDLNYTEFRQQLQPFLLNSAKFAYDIVEDKRGSLKHFRLTIGLTQLNSDEKVLKCAKEMRKICEESREVFDIRTYSTLWNLADQFEIVWPQTLQDIFISIGIMFVVALLFIPRFVCAFTIGASILSVSFGVLGFLHFLGAKLNATSMITLAMSVGFSVDFASHITYSFMSIESEDAKTRLSGALRQVGWPILQTSTAIFLGIITLGTVNNQLVQAVFKAVLLVILFGLAHALVYVPLLLLKFHQLCQFLSRYFK